MFCRYSIFNDFENLGVLSGFNENLLKQLKTRIRKHKLNILCVQGESIQLDKGVPQTSHTDRRGRGEEVYVPHRHQWSSAGNSDWTYPFYSLHKRAHRSAKTQQRAHLYR